MKTTIQERLAGLAARSVRWAALVIAICITGGAWADTTLKTTVSGGSFTVNNVNAAAFDHCTQSVSSPTLTIPASTDLPAGTKVAITTISLGKRADDNNPTGTVVPDKIRIVVGTQTYTSAAVAEDSSDYFISEANNSNTARKMKYSFDGTGCILEVGETYNIKLLNSSGAEISEDLNVRVVKNSQSLFGDTIYADVSGNRWTPVQEIAGDIIYTCTVASNGSSTWDITPPSSSTLRYWFEVAESTSFNIGTLPCKQAYFNIGDNQTLSLSGSVTASSGIYVYGGEIAVTTAPTFTGTVKGDGTLYYNGVRPTTTGTDVVLTDSEWRGTVRITYNKENTASGTNRALFPQHWGSAYSKIKWNGVVGYFGGCTSAAGWILEDLTVDCPALKKNDGASSSTTTAPSLEGDGEFYDASNPSERFRFTTGSSFTGKITITSSAGNGMNVQFGATAVTKAARTIHVLSGASVKVASGKTWRADGGIVVNGTLTLEDSTSALSGTVTGSGVIECTESIPSITGLSASGWTGTVKIAADASSGTSWTSGDLMNSGSTLEVTAGMLKVADVSKLTGSVKIDNGAYLWVTDTVSTSADLKISDFSGILYLDKNSALESMQVDMGTLRNLPTGHVFYSGKTVDVGVTLKEIHGEGGTITLSAPDLTNHATSYSIVREDGVTVLPTLSDGVLTYDPAISGVATMYDATFNNSTQDPPEFAYKKTAGATIGLDTALAPKYNNSENNDTTGIYLRHHPYVNGAKTDIHGLTDFTVVVVGQMSPTHKTQFLHIGSTTGSNKGLLIATTDKDDEVIIVPNTGKVVDESNYVKVKVPNAASARHAYVIKKSGNVFTVWVDGIKRGNFTVAAGWGIGSSDHAGVQVGSDFGGEIQRDTSNPDRYKSVADSLDETGVVNVIRIFDYVITDAQAQAIVAAYPYVSKGGLYTRTISANADLSETDAWAKNGSATTYALPEGATVDEVFYNPSATVTVGADATLTVNADLNVDTLTVEGGNDLSVVSDGTHSVHVSGAAVVNSPLSITYGALSLAGTPVQLGSGGTIAFDCSGIDISNVKTTTRYQLTGLMDQDDDKVTVTLPEAPYRTARKNYNDNGYYELVVAPDHEPGTEVYYKSGYFGKGGDSPFTVVLSDGTTPTVVFEGDTVVIDGKSSQDPIYVGELPDNVAAIKVARTCRLASGNASNAMLDGAVVTVADGVVLTIQYNYNNINLGTVAFNKVGDEGTGSVVLDNNSGTLSISGAVTGTAPIAIDSGKTVAVDSTGSIAVSSGSTFAEGATVTGSGRMVFKGALPSSNLKTSFQNSTTWTGTVELKDYEEESEKYRIINFGEYGNRNSAVALNRVTSTMFTGNGRFTDYPDVTLGEIEICEGGWTDGNTGTFSIDPTYTAKLTGHGPITVTTGGDGSVKFIGVHTFDGSVSFNSGTGKQVAFMRTADDTIPTVTAKAIVVAGGLDMSIASNKTWTADGGIKIDGSLTVLTEEKAEAISGEISAYQDDDKIDETVGESTTTYESNPLTTILEDSSKEVSNNQASMGTVTVIGNSSITGSGGALMKALTINAGATLTYDPVITPLRVKSAPVFNGKLKLAERYAGVKCGKFHLITYPTKDDPFAGCSPDELKALVDSSSFANANTEYTVSEEDVDVVTVNNDVPVSDYKTTKCKQLVLKVGDYDEDAKPVSIAQFGDSITEGIWRNNDGSGTAYRGTPNYRIPLMQLLEAYGYKPEARGYREVGSEDANGVKADDNYAWHTGISAQRIYTGGPTRAGFMESIEAHLEQVGVTDIITLKIGTNDANGGETADNMFEGWTNLVWKIVRMRPTSKIVVCAPIHLRSGEGEAQGLREKIAEYVNKTPDQGGFPVGQVTLINGGKDSSGKYSGTEIIPNNAAYYLDNLHPNWNGHLRFANAWLPAVTNAIESMTARAEKKYIDQNIAQTAASAEDVDELAAYRAGYVKLATFTNFGTKLSTWGESPYASVNEAYKEKTMSRVAYFVARKTKASPDTRYVWVDMDADETTGTKLADFGVPTSAEVNGVVNNLHIYSNSSAIENVAPDVSGVKGTLMRTEKGVSKTDYSGLIALGVPTGPYGYDWNDTIGSGAWGVMNMARIFDGVTPTNHRKLLAAQMLFDFNGFNGERQNALGLGNFAVHGPYLYGNGAVQNYNLNWSFTTAKDDMPTMDARALDTGVIEIWGKPVPAEVTVDVDNGVAKVIAVPRDGLKANELIDTSNRDEGDQLMVYSAGNYYSWTLTDGSWKPADVFKKESEADQVMTAQKAASEVNLKKGHAVWVTCKDNTKPIKLVGYAGAASSVEVDSGWNLLASTTGGAADVAVFANSADTVVVITGGAPRTYTYKNGEWGYADIRVRSEQPVDGIVLVEPFHNNTDTVIPAGKGFWYVKGKESSTESIDL